LSQNQNYIRNLLKEFADFRRGGNDNGSWVLKDSYQIPNDEEMRKKKINPDEIALYECMMAGAQRLNDIGIKSQHNLTSSLTKDVIESLPDHLKKVAKFIEEELLLSPWNLTKNFVDSIKGKCVLQLYGIGDPSGRGEGFSFIKQSQKATKSTEKPPKNNVGTDLRKLNLEQTKELLMEFGVPDEKIQSMKRWDQIKLITKISNDRIAAGETSGELLQYVRKKRKEKHTKKLIMNDFKKFLMANQKHFLIQIPKYRVMKMLTINY